jgi:translation initiation factor RLI1
VFYVFHSYVIVVEHDLSVLDYLSDFICCLYGKPGAYGVVTLPFSVREGINIFLAGFVPTENLRFRDESLTFKVTLVHKTSKISRFVMELCSHVSILFLDRGDPGKCRGSCFVPAVQVPYHDQDAGKFQALCS